MQKYDKNLIYITIIKYSNIHLNLVTLIIIIYSRKVLFHKIHDYIIVSLASSIKQIKKKSFTHLYM